MKPDTTLTLLSLFAIALEAFHLSQDIVYGYDPSGPSNLVGVLILTVWLFATLALSGRRSGYVILILGSLFAALMPVGHMMGSGVRAEVVKSAGGLFYLWTLMALGASGTVAFALSVQGLWRLERSVWRTLLWSALTIAAGAALLAFLLYTRG